MRRVKYLIINVCDGATAVWRGVGGIGANLKEHSPMRIG